MAPRASKRLASKDGDAADPATANDAAKPPAKRARKQPIADPETSKAEAQAPSRRKRKAQDKDADVEEPSSEAELEASNDSADGGGAAAAAAEKKGAQSKGRAGSKKGSAGGGGAAAAAPRDPPGPRYFLMKSEPEEFSLDDLAAKPNQTSHWEGVRNAQARNIMRSMRLGDEAFFYHSSCKVPAVVGVVQVVREAYPDHFAFDKSSKYYDASSKPDSPKWWMVDVQLVRRTTRAVTLAELRQEGARGAPIDSMVLINKSRLSVQPVSLEQWQRILELEQQPGPEGQGDGAEGSKPGKAKGGAAKGGAKTAPKPKPKGKAKGKAAADSEEQESDQQDDDEDDVEPQHDEEDEEEEDSGKGKTTKKKAGVAGGGRRTKKGRQ